MITEKQGFRRSKLTAECQCKDELMQCSEISAACSRGNQHYPVRSNGQRTLRRMSLFLFFFFPYFCTYFYRRYAMFWGLFARPSPFLAQIVLFIMSAVMWLAWLMLPPSAILDLMSLKCSFIDHLGSYWVIFIHRRWPKIRSWMQLDLAGDLGLTTSARWPLVHQQNDTMSRRGNSRPIYVQSSSCKHATMYPLRIHLVFALSYDCQACPTHQLIIPWTWFFFYQIWIYLSPSADNRNRRGTKTHTSIMQEKRKASPRTRVSSTVMTKRGHAEFLSPLFCDSLCLAFVLQLLNIIHS